MTQTNETNEQKQHRYLQLFCTMVATIIETRPDLIVVPPRPEQLIKGLQAVSGWYAAQPACRETAAKAVKLIELLVTQYEEFVAELFVTPDGPFSEAARKAVDRQIQFKSIAELQWWLQNHEFVAPLG